MSDAARWSAAPHSSDPEARLDAISRLDSLPEQERFAPLVAMLGDPEWRVRKAVTSRLNKLPLTPHLLELLLNAIVQEGDPWLRTAAMEAMVNYGCRESEASRVVVFLLDALQRVDPEPRKFVAELLGQLGDPRAVAPLIGALRHEDENLQLSVLAALANIGNRSALPAVIERLQRGSGQVRFAALSALQQLGDSSAAPVVVQALSQPSIRPFAIETLGEIGDAQAVAPLWEWWVSGHRQEREGALVALVKIVNRAPEAERRGLLAAIRQWYRPDHAGEVVARFEHPESRVQQAAIALAGWMLKPAALQPLVHLLGGDLASQARQALLEMAEDQVEPLLELLPRATPTIYRALIDLLSGVADPRLLPVMRAALNHPDHWVRRSGALGLAAQRDCGSAPLVVELLSDPDEEVQEAALLALQHCGSMDVVPSVIARLSDESPTVRRNAARALGVLRADRASAHLALALNDPDSGVRAAAITALDLIGGAPGLETLTEHLLLALGDESSPVRLAAARALARRVAAVPVEWWACLVKDPDQWVRAMAARLAGQSQEPVAASVLQQCLRDDSGAVQIAALEVIRSRPDLGAPEAVRAALQSHDADVVAAALGAVAAMASGPAPAARRDLVAAMVECLAHPSWVVRIAAIEALAAFSPADARQHADGLASRDAHARVRKVAARLREGL